MTFLFLIHYRFGLYWPKPPGDEVFRIRGGQSFSRAQPPVRSFSRTEPPVVSFGLLILRPVSPKEPTTLHNQYLHDIETILITSKESQKHVNKLECIQRSLYMIATRDQQQQQPEK